MIYGIWKNGAIERRLQADNAFSLNETNYPARWLICATKEEREGLSIYPILFSAIEEDQRYYATVEGEPSFSAGSIIIPLTFTLKSPDAIRSTKLGEIASRRAGAQTQGVLAEGSIFPTDAQAYSDIWLVARDIADGLLETAQVVDRKGIVKIMTALQVSALRQSMIALREDARKNDAALTLAVDAAWYTGDPAAVLAADTSVGWPVPPVLPEDVKVSV